MDKAYNKDSIKHILALIRWGAGGFDNLFKVEADEIAEEFELEGLHEQADFIKAQFNEIQTFIPMEVPSAEETKKKTTVCKSTLTKRAEQKNLKYVLEAISKASKMGEFQCMVESYKLTDGIVEKLRKAGYEMRVDNSPVFGTSKVIIDWSGKE